MDPVRILIAEDEILVARDTENMLLNFGYDVVGIAGTGEDALALAEKLAPDLILMDIRLKGNIGGIEAADRIREHEWQMDRELRRREEHYRVLVESLEEGIVQFDIQDRFTFV